MEKEHFSPHFISDMDKKGEQTTYTCGCIHDQNRKSTTDSMGTKQDGNMTRTI